MEKVGIYVRISSDKELGKDTSQESQTEAGIAFAKSLNSGLGLPYEVYLDINVSGRADIKKRDDFGRFIKDIRDGVITHVFAINQSRIERNRATWDLFQATVLNAQAKWYPDGKEFSLESTTNRFMANMLSLVNQLHADLTSDAVKVAFANNAMKGKGHGQKAYGIEYDDDGYMQHHPKEIEVVKDIFKWSLEGIGTYSIAKKLNGMDDAPTRYAILESTPAGRKGKNVGRQNKKWWGSTVSGILKNKLYMGIHEFGETIAELPHLAIMTRKEFEAVQDNLKKNKREKSGRRVEHKYLLNELLYCSECGYKFFGKRRVTSRENTYKCSGKQAPIYACKQSKGFNIARIETFILKHLFSTKDLQNHLNSLEDNDDTLELLDLEIHQLQRNIDSTSKMVTRSFNLLYESDNPNLTDDQRIRDKYIADKDKLKHLDGKLKEVKKKKEDYDHGLAISRVNKTIDGFDLNMSFEAIKDAVKNLIERIDVEYISLEKNGRFIFKIKYRGFNERIEYVATQQLDRFACLKYYRDVDPEIYGEGHARFGKLEGSYPKFLDLTLSHSQWNEYFDRFFNQHRMPVRVKKDELVHFE